MQIGGVTKAQIMSYDKMEDVFALFQALLQTYASKYDSKDKFFLVGYNNASFDNNFLRAWFVQNFDNYFGSLFWSSTIDVMILAAEYLKDVRHKMKDFKLMTVAKQLGIEVDETKLHDGGYDIDLTIQIYKIITNGK